MSWKRWPGVKPAKQAERFVVEVGDKAFEHWACCGASVTGPHGYNCQRRPHLVWEQKQAQ